MPVRLRLLQGTMLLCFALIISRLFYIQVYKGEKYKEMAESQMVEEVVLKPQRGAVLDRNGIPFTDTDSADMLIVVPAQIRDRELAAGIISKLSNQDQDKLEARLVDGRDSVLTFIVEDAELFRLIKDSLPHGIYTYHDTLRYAEDGLARHVIGYLGGDGSGMMGIEKDYEQDLKSSSRTMVRIYRDRSKRILPGLDAEFVNKGDETGFNLKTTLDYGIQKVVEQTMDIYAVTGAAVVLDADTGDILAMASRPQFDQNNINMSLNRDDAPLINRALNGYPPGSVFKTIVAAAAMEENKVSDTDIFNCSGSINVNGVTYRCFEKEGHGNIDFKSAYAESCNVAFIQIGMRIGGEKILDMAKRFGLDEPESIGISVSQNINLPGKNETVGAGIGNISIGQGSLLVSPLQIADMTATIANKGYRYKPRLVDSIVDDNGKVLREVTQSEGYRVIDSDIAKSLSEMMKLAVSSGTGKKADVEGMVAGKTGTAEFNKEKDISHSWFTGFFPYNNPHYVMAVMVEGGGVGGGKAAEIFHDIVDAILKINKNY
ncbi:MAG: penicillin-binding transpeptidase domain-containing protein [Thermoanaerobacteraceae bacterium]|nr:penicillin-binding transpeptidase domain-containing protein [Thermoanaerobacteraceae bacterium]